MTQQEENEIIRKREKWFSKNYAWLQREVQYTICKKTGPMADYADDLLQIATLQFLNKPLEQQNQMLEDGKAGWYILTTAGFHIRSSSSPFYNIVRKHKMSTRSGALPDRNNEDDDDLIESQDWYQCLQRVLPEMNFYFRQLLLDKYQDGLSFDDLHKKYNITKSSLTKDVQVALQYVRCKCDPNTKC